MEAAIRTAYFAITGKNLKDVEVKAVRGIKEVKKGEVDINGKKVRVAVIHGMVNAHEILEEVRACKKAGKPAPYDFIEIMACRGGCIAGGGQPYGADDEIRDERMEGLYTDDEKCKIRCSHDNPSIQKLYKDFLGAPLSEKSEKYLHTAYKEVPVYKA